MLARGSADERGSARSVASVEKPRRHFLVRRLERVIKNCQRQVGGNDVVDVRDALRLERAHSGLNATQKLDGPFGAERDSYRRVAERVCAQRVSH